MKKALFIMLAIVVTLAAACSPDENQNKNKNSNANANVNANANGNNNLGPLIGPNDKRVEIFIHDKGAGFYTIEDPSPVTLNVGLKQKVYWCVSYDGSTAPDDVEIYEFHTTLGPLMTNPFGTGSPTDNDFDVPKVEINACVPTLHAPKPGITSTVEYKYTVRAKVGGVEMGRVDPRVIISP